MTCQINRCESLSRGTYRLKYYSRTLKQPKWHSFSGYEHPQSKSGQLGKSTFFEFYGFFNCPAPLPPGRGVGVVDVGDEHFFELPPTGTEIYPKHSIVLQLSSENEAFKEGPQKGGFFEKNCLLRVLNFAWGLIYGAQCFKN